MTKKDATGAPIVEILAFANGNIACLNGAGEQVCDEQAVTLRGPDLAEALREELRRKLARGVVSASTSLRTQWDMVSTTAGDFLSAAPTKKGA